MRFRWKKEYYTNIDEVDNQHQHFLNIINDLYDAILKRETDKRLEGIFNDLIDYTEKHFRTEEKYFDEFKYKYTDEHKIEHNLLRERLKELQGQYNTNKTVLSFALIDFLVEWLTNHLEEMDSKYIECFKEHGK
jgi:hemerythrin-like metal-binding protein